MRFIHTSDWHLGRLLEQHHLTDDQAQALDQLFLLAKDSESAAFLISGDIYDRGVPPPEAVELLSEFVSRLALDLRITVIMIAGNHDSRERLGFGALLLKRANVHVFGPPVGAVPFIDLEDANGPVRFYALPYAEPMEWREVLKDESVRDHQSGFIRLLGSASTGHPKALRSVLLAHCFAIGGRVSESERPLVVGGGGQVDAGLFDSYSYAALGHLHRPQRVKNAWYSGSLLKYSKSEADHQKSVFIIDMNAVGACSVERVPIAPRRDLRVVEGLFDELLKNDPSEDYIHIVLRDKGRVMLAAERLRTVFPNLIGLEYPEESVGVGRAAALSGLTEDQLFEAFYKEVLGEAPEPTHLEAYREAVKAVRGEEQKGR
jgi:exonuclease SbcD